MLYLMLDTQTREWFDGNGNLFADGFPQIPLGNSEGVVINCGIYVVDENTSERKFIPDDSFNFPGVSALLSIDNNFTRHLKATTVDELLAGSVTSIKLNISNPTRGKIPAYGTLRLFNAAGNIEAIEYTSRTISGNIVEFTCAANSKLTSSYAKGANADCPESLYAQAAMNAEASNPSKGEFAFVITIDSEKLREKADYEDIEYIPDVKGMELLIFGVEEDKTLIYNSFLCDTFSVPVPMADPNPNPQMPDTYKDNVVAIASALISAGFDVEVQNNNSVAEIRLKLSNLGNDSWSNWVEVGYTLEIQYSSDNSNWHDTAVADDKYIRTSVDGGKTWSNGLYVKGESGKDGNTPEKGVDYYTEADKTELLTELKDYIDNNIANGEW